MTQNQIAYAGVREESRHNEAVEGETKRHNLATEDLQNQANANDAERNRITDAHNTRMDQLTKEYNDRYLAMQKAQGDERNRIQAQLASIEQQKASATQEYQTRMTEIYAVDSAIKEQATAENERHNKEMEGIEGTFKFLNTVLESKRLEYQDTWNRMNVDISREMNRIKRLQVENDFLLGSAKIKLDQEFQPFRLSESQNRSQLLANQAFWTNWEKPFTLPGNMLGNALKLFK